MATLIAASLLSLSSIVGASERSATNTTPASAAFEQDRQAILKMAGTYAVTFDMRETASFVSEYQPIDPKVSKGHEVVRVIEDSGRVIRLQHLLVIARGTQKPMVIKH